MQSRVDVALTECLEDSDRADGAGRWSAALAEERRQLTRFAPLIQNLVLQDLRVRYQRSVLGFVWTLLNPVLMMTTMSVVFSHFIPVEHYTLYLFSGMLPWNFLHASLNDCLTCLISNEGLIRRIHIPKLVFPLVRVLINLITFTLSLVVLFVLLGPLGARPSWALLLLPVAIGLLAVFTLGLGLFLATANTFYRDCGHLIGVVLQAWYFMTPILYDTARWSPEQRWRFWINPAYPFIKIFQSILRDGCWPSATALLAAAGYAVGSLGVGYAVFKSQESKLVFRL